MKWIVILGILAFLVWRMLPSKGVKSITTEDLKGMLKDQSKQFIDVRTPAEYKGNHIRQFKNYPVTALKSNLNSLDKTKETVVICQSGMRSMQAAKVLSKAGFSNVVNVKGGMLDWRE